MDSAGKTAAWTRPDVHCTHTAIADGGRCRTNAWPTIALDCVVINRRSVEIARAVSAMPEVKPAIAAAEAAPRDDARPDRTGHRRPDGVSACRGGRAVPTDDRSGAACMRRFADQFGQNPPTPPCRHGMAERLCSISR